MASLVQTFKPIWPFLVGFAVSGYAFTKAYMSSYRNRMFYA